VIRVVSGEGEPRRLWIGAPAGGAGCGEVSGDGLGAGAGVALQRAHRGVSGPGQQLRQVGAGVLTGRDLLAVQCELAADRGRSGAADVPAADVEHLPAEVSACGGGGAERDSGTVERWAGGVDGGEGVSRVGVETRIASTR